MNPTLKPLVESAIRYIIAAGVGAVGATVSETQTEAAVSVIAALAIGAVSLLWSKYSDKKVVQQNQAGAK
jgi:hypothetical protein